MSLSKKEKKQLQTECNDGNNIACAILGKSEAEKHIKAPRKMRNISDAGGQGIRLFLVILFWASILACHILTIFEIIELELLWFTMPLVLAFGILMVKGEQLEKMPKAFWIAGIMIPITFGVFLGFFIFWIFFDWVLFGLFIFYTVVMILYIVSRKSGGDAKSGIILWVSLITEIIAIGLSATATTFWYIEMYLPLIVMFWIIAGFLQGLVIILLIRALWQSA